MIPLVDYEHGLAILRELVISVGEQEGLRDRPTIRSGR
jgi:hypothetical protein